MPLHELAEAVREVRERAEKFRGELQKSEALTRYALVDPILRALGWDTEDPSQVRPEFSTDSGTPDYALLWEEKPHIMVEAKALGKRLEGAQDKAFQYAWQNGVPYYVATDGSRWEVYNIYERDRKKRGILDVDIATSGPGAAARTFLALWRPAMPAVEVPMPPVVEPSSPPPPDTLSLVELQQKMKTGEIPRDSPPPQKVIFLNAVEKATKSWRGLFLAVVEWSQDRLADKLPLTWPSTGRVVIAREASGMRGPRAGGAPRRARYQRRRARLWRQLRAECMAGYPYGGGRCCRQR